MFDGCQFGHWHYQCSRRYIDNVNTIVTIDSLTADPIYSIVITNCRQYKVIDTNEYFSSIAIPIVESINTRGNTIKFIVFFTIGSLSIPSGLSKANTTSPKLLLWSPVYYWTMIYNLSFN